MRKLLKRVIKRSGGKDSKWLRPKYEQLTSRVLSAGHRSRPQRTPTLDIQGFPERRTIKAGVTTFPFHLEISTQFSLGRQLA